MVMMVKFTNNKSIKIVKQIENKLHHQISDQ
jgi:hypothetical protein